MTEIKMTKKKRTEREDSKNSLKLKTLLFEFDRNSGL